MDKSYRFLVAVFIMSLYGCKRGADDSLAFEVELPKGKSSHVKAAGKFWEVPDFSLEDQDGKVFSLRKLSGKIWIVDFFYSSCKGPCPMLSSRLSDLHKKFENDSRVGFLSISTDPEKDTSEVLKLYAKKFDADSRWVFLTGRKEEVYRLANQGFKLSLQEVEGAAEPISHSTRLALVDSIGWVRGFYEGVGDGGDNAARELIRDISKLMEETK